MKEFLDAEGGRWIASAREEQTPRHHGRWYLVFEDPVGRLWSMPEVRWQTRATAERTLRTMSRFELRRRADMIRERALLAPGASPVAGAADESARTHTSASAG